MAWKIELSAQAKDELNKLDAQHARRILKFLRERLGKLEDPRAIGKALHGPRFGELWRYRVGDYRLVCKLKDERLIVVVLRGTPQGNLPVTN